MSTNSTPKKAPHFVLVPLMAQGHMIPMVDMAQLLSTHGAITTLVTTPLNMNRFSSIIDRIQSSNLPINFLSLKFPCAEVGLPEGCENIDAVPSSSLLKNFMQGCALLKEPLITHLKQQEHAPNCIIFDCGHIWIDSVAKELGIPRITFNGYGCFALLCRHIFHYNAGLLEKIEDENEVFVMPGMPHRVEMTKSRSPSNFGGKDMDDYRKRMMEVETTSNATIVNTFEELEAPYIEYLGKALNMKVWTVGPMSLYNTQIIDMAFRGNKSSMNELQITKWLDSKEENSVLYVSFGSLARTPPSQLFEIGLGLEASRCPFVWVVKPGTRSYEIEEWLGNGFEDRVKDIGLIIRGWAPQLVVLAHPSVGGFMTHCGWNSSLESVAASVPMITWPQFGEQFLNEKLMVEVHRVGQAIGVDGPVKWGFEHEEAIVKRDQVEESVRKLMNGGDDVRGMRERVKELGEKAKRAMEVNGSSYENMKLLIQQIRDGMK